MTARRVARIAREVLLTSAAVLGVVCILVTVAGAVAGVRPLVIQSGSMSPAIQTGDLSISRTVAASDLEKNDVVSVRTSSGSRVTHRIVTISGSGDQRELSLKGDANTVADQEIYAVTSAERVLFTIPKLGHVVDAATTPVGLFVLGMYVAGLLVLVFRRPGGDPPQAPPRETPPADTSRRRARRGAVPEWSELGRRATRAAVVPAVAVALLASTPAVAAPWADLVPVSGTSYSAHTVLPPTTVSCSESSDVATVSWPERDARYDYEVTLVMVKSNTSTPNGSIASTKQATGAAVSATFSTASDFGYSGSILANRNEEFEVRVRSYLANATTWRSEVVVSSATIKVRSTEVLGQTIIRSVSC